MENTWFTDAVTGDFNKNVEVAGRYDGLFNLWRKVIKMDEDGSFSSYWEVIGVFETKDAAEAEKKRLRTNR